MYKNVEEFMAYAVSRSHGEKEFHQAVEEVVESLWPFLQDNPDYLHAKILERIIEPERVLMFRVPWRNDRGEFEVNRGFRVGSRCMSGSTCPSLTVFDLSFST